MCRGYCRGGHCPPVRYNLTNSPETNANTKHFTARARNARPYIHTGRVYDKVKFEL